MSVLKNITIMGTLFFLSSCASSKEAGDKVEEILDKIEVGTKKAAKAVAEGAEAAMNEMNYH